MLRSPTTRSLVLLLLALAFVTVVYAPGLSGPWLVDDDTNLGEFRTYAAGTAPYAELINDNLSGPLGRRVTMASFAANHYLGLFDTHSLKVGNLAIHLLNGALIFCLCLSLFRRRSPLPGVAPQWLALGLASWWLLLPLHISTVLYIVQRMTLLAGFFSLATCLLYVLGRQALAHRPARGWILLATSVLLGFPLALLAKESALAILPWLVLIELFFFSPAPAWRIGSRRAVAALLLLALLLLVLCTKLFSLSDDYLGRDFTLTERLLTQGRVLWSYIHGIFLPDGSQLGLFNDDFPISRSLLSPPTTLLALAGLVGLLGMAIHLASGRAWAVSFGILFYFSGHLLESTVIPLELYFEHRNYLPSLGLLLAVAAAAGQWQAARKPLLLACFAAYLGLLGFAGYQRSHIWADKHLLLQTSAENHPLSLRAWTDYPENLLETGHPEAALEAALHHAQAKPADAAISYMQMVSIYCRIGQPAPAALVQHLAQALQETRSMASNLTTPLGIGLDLILSANSRGQCADTDFFPLAPALAQLDGRLVRHYGDRRKGLWLQRLTLAEWLLALHQPPAALAILEDIWREGDRSEMPTAGLTLARTLLDEGRQEQARQVLAELAAVTQDAPDDFRADMARLQQRASGNP